MENFPCFPPKKGSLYFLLIHLVFGNVFSRQILTVQLVKSWKPDANNSELYPCLSLAMAFKLLRKKLNLHLGNYSDQQMTVRLSSYC